MAEARQFPLYGDGIKGVVIAPARFLDDSLEKRVRLDDGSEFMVASEALELRPDGTFYLRSSQKDHPIEEPPREAPPVQEPPDEQPAPGPSPDQDIQPGPAQTAADQFFRHGFEVRRVPVNRVLDEPALPRQEGDAMVYPVMEEVLVVQKKLVLREEIYVTPQRTAIEPRRIEVER